MKDREYGKLAQIGIAVPQANPVVEPEMQALMPNGVNLITTRLQGSRTDSRDRLVGYLDNLETSLGAFDTAELDAAGYACTGSTYIVGGSVDAERMQKMSDIFGCPVISAAQAIKSALEHLEIRRIAVFAPYPHWLAELGIAYWRNCGFDVVDHAAAPLDPSDTRSVYKIRSETAIEKAALLQLEPADALLLTGTGMPTLKAINVLASKLRKPVLSSNLCLAWALQRAAGLGDALVPASVSEPLFGGWTGRLRA